MPNLFARTTPLPDLAGRLDYIANPDRQENLLATYDSAESLLDGQYWQILAQECRASFAQNGKTTRRVKDRKTGEVIEQALKCREAREVHMLLSNSLLDRMDPDEIARTLSAAFTAATGEPNRVAVHFNKTKKSLHAHVVFPERHLLETPDIRIAERNLFFDAQGKRRYRRSDILDANGQLLPGCRICRKGEVYHQRYFSSADTEIQSRDWLKSLKTNVILQLRNGALRGDVEITEYDPSTGKLAQQYIGKEVDQITKANIEAYNEMVKTFNGLVDAGRVTLDEALRIQEECNRQADRNAYLSNALEEIYQRERDELERMEKEKAEKDKQAQFYTWPDSIADAVHSPYKVRLYDKSGRERSLLELIVILALVTLENEQRKWDARSDVTVQKVKQNTLYAHRDWKIQEMVDTLRIAREENINSPDEVETRLAQAGKALSKTRAAAHRLAESKNRMEPVAQAIADYRRLEALCERIYAMPDNSLDKQIQMAQNRAELARYKEAKAIIYRAGIASPEAREEFLARFRSISQKAAEAEQDAASLKEQYHRLSKLRHSVEMAQNQQYCFDLEYFPDPPEAQEPPLEMSLEAQQDPQNNKKWDGDDENNGGFTGDR